MHLGADQDQRARTIRRAAVLAIVMSGVLAACTPGAPPPEFATSPAVGTSTAAAFPGSRPQQEAVLIACVPDGAVITVELERIDSGPFNTEWDVDITDVSPGLPGTGSFPWQEFYLDDVAVNATFVSAPIPGPRCLQVWMTAPRYFDLPSPRFTYRVTW
jgi:hypothetical protein